MAAYNVSSEYSDQGYKNAIENPEQERVDDEPTIRCGQRTQRCRNSHDKQRRLVKVQAIDPSVVRNVTEE